MILKILIFKSIICTNNNMINIANSNLPIVSENILHVDSFNSFNLNSDEDSADFDNLNYSPVLIQNETEKNLIFIYEKYFSIFFKNDIKNLNKQCKINQQNHDYFEINQQYFSCLNPKSCGVCFKMNIQGLFFKINENHIVILAERTLKLFKFDKNIKIFIFLFSSQVCFENKGVIESHLQSKENLYDELEVNYPDFFFLIKLELETFERTYDEAILKHNLYNEIYLNQIFSILSKILFHLDSLFISCVRNKLVSFNFKKVLYYLHYLILEDKIKDSEIVLYIKFLQNFLLLFAIDDFEIEEIEILEQVCSFNYENDFLFNFQQLNKLFEQDTTIFVKFRANCLKYYMFNGENIDHVLVTKNLSDY